MKRYIQMEKTKNPLKKINYPLIIIISALVYLFYSLFASIFEVRRNHPSSYAHGTVKSFSTAAATYAANNDEQIFFENGTTDFGDYFAHVSPKGSYVFTYFASENRGKYLYFATPMNPDYDKYAILADESNKFYKAYMDQKTIDKLLRKGENFVRVEVDWTKEGRKRIKRIDFEEWTREY